MSVRDVALAITGASGSAYGLRLLEVLISAPNRVYSRDELEQELWGDEHPQSDSLRSHMHMLRRALTDSRGGSPIETVHGIGYRFAVADADARPA